MPICVPVRDMRDTAAFLRLVEESPQPITVTKNGYDACVVMRSSDYDSLREQVELYTILTEAEEDFAAGRCLDAFDAVAKIRERHDL